MIATVFSVLSILAIVAGGVISAFSARRPGWATAWVSAYLVLVVGIVQFGVVAAWHRLGEPSDALVLWALIAYNLGNAGVIAGTLQKKRLPYYRVLVNGGGLCIALAMALLLTAVRNAQASWTLAAFVALTVVILVSMPVGLWLSNRRHKAVRQ